MGAVWDDARVAEGLRRQLDALAALEADGAELVGWKVGLGAPAAREQAGIDGPLVGYLTDRTVVPDGAWVDISGWSRPAIEAELAIHVGARGTIAGVGQAIELADVDRPLDEVEEIVAGNIFHRGVILGPARTDPGVGSIRLLHNGAEAAQTGDPTALTGALADLTVHVGEWLDAAGRQLEAGQVIIAGATVPLLFVDPGDKVDYECQPLGHLAVRLV